VKVEFLNLLRQVTGTASMETEAASVAELLNQLVHLYGPEFKTYLLDDASRLKPGVSILVNGRHILYLQGLATPLTPEDQVTFIPPAAGG